MSTDPTARCHALVPAAGLGTRAGTAGPKQYALVAGLPVVAHTLQALQGVRRLVQTLVVLSPDDQRFTQELPQFAAWAVRCGGASRAESVRNGLQALLERGAALHDWVLVHDAARCLVRPAWIDALIDACEHDAVGGLLAVPLADTLKAADGGRVQATLDRSHKWQAQTPQMFRIGLLQQALERTLQQPGEAATDEASAIEALGHRPLLVPGALENFKLTYPPDFALAERLLQTRNPEVPR